MLSLKRLDVAGYKNQKVPNMYFDFNSDQIAIFLPGLGYSNDSPILYYTGSYLIQKEINILRVDYKYYECDNYLKSTKDEQKQWLIEDVNAMVETVLSGQNFKRIILIGKSLGTMALGEILLIKRNLKDAEVIWLTPLLNDEELLQQILKINNRSLLIMGTNDSRYNEDILKKVLEKKNIESLIIDGANHQLDIENNIFKSINEAKNILSKIISFVDAQKK